MLELYLNWYILIISTFLLPLVLINLPFFYLWSPQLELAYSSQLQQLQMILKRFFRVKTFYHLHLVHTEILFKKLTIWTFIEIQILNFAYSYFRSLLPLIFNNYYFQSTSSIHSYSTWQSTNEILSLSHTNTNQFVLRSLWSSSSGLSNSLKTLQRIFLPFGLLKIISNLLNLIVITTKESQLYSNNYQT